MIKFVCVIPRRKDLSREEFFDYWKNRHGPLVRRHARALGIRRYVQSHRIAAGALTEFAGMRGWPDVAYDGLTEIWLDSLEAFAASFVSEEGQRANAELVADEAQFADQPNVLVFMSEEHEIV